MPDPKIPDVIQIPNGITNALKREYVPEGNTIIFEAPQRFGKTLGMIIWGWSSHLAGRKVFSNIQVGYPHERLEFSEVKLEDGKSRFWNGHIMVDELNFYYDARRSMTGTNVEAGAFLLQQKKQGCNLTGTTHNLDYLDLRIREHYDYLVNPRVIPAHPQSPVVLVLEISNGPLQAPFHKTLALDCRPFLGVYDSFAVYDPFKKTEEDNDEDDWEKPARRKSRGRI